MFIYVLYVGPEADNSITYPGRKKNQRWGWKRDWISQLRHSFIAFLVHKSMSDHQSWVHQKVLRKLNVSFSYWLRMQSETRTFRRAFGGFRLRLIRQNSGFILHSHQALSSCPKIFFWILRVRLGIITAWKRQVLIWSLESTNQWIWRWNQSELSRWMGVHHRSVGFKPLPRPWSGKPQRQTFSQAAGRHLSALK